MNSSSVPASAVNPASAALASCVLRIVRGDWTTGLWSSHTRSHWIIDGRRQVRQQPDRVEVEGELHVAVALVPRRHLVAVDGVHVDVDAQEVVAALGPLLDDVVEEVLPVQALALQPALHVGEGDDDGVDVALLDLHAQLLEAQQVWVSFGHRLVPLILGRFT